MGLHFAHDAGIAILSDGVEVNNLIRERHNRAKHSFGISVSHIEQSLADARLSVDDIDMVAITCGFTYEIVVDDAPDQLKFEFTPHPNFDCPSTFYDLLSSNDDRLGNRMNHDMLVLDKVYSNAPREQYYKNLFPEHKTIKREDLGTTTTFSNFVNTPIWDEAVGLSDLANLDINPFLNTNMLRYGFHYPMTVTLKGRQIPAIFVQHHASHAASAYYTSRAKQAAVLTHDGALFGGGPNNGMIFFGDENRLLPIAPNHLQAGHLYDIVGSRLGFDLFGAAGKLMGLAPYGKPRFFDRKMVGNIHDWKRLGFAEAPEEWCTYCFDMASKMGYDISAVGDLNRILEPVCVDLAASTQKLFEEIILQTTEEISKMFNRAGLNLDTLCYAGGTSLNCPANSRLYAEGPFKHIHIPPNCDDSGLSMGAAQYLHFNILDMPRTIPTKSSQRRIPFQGLTYSQELDKTAIKKVADRVHVERPVDPALDAAKDIRDNKIIAWFEGRSEIGPRALGHRSLLINPTFAENWDRMNDLKTRERWRPFAPAVLAEDAAIYFRGLPDESPYMLFTAQVIASDTPAITHVDGSARVQTVTEETGGLFNVLTHLKDLTGNSVVLNTSFNGPREAIIEKPDEALTFLLTTGLDALYLNGARVTRAN